MPKVDFVKNTEYKVLINYYYVYVDFVYSYTARTASFPRLKPSYVLPQDSNYLQTAFHSNRSCFRAYLMQRKKKKPV